MIIRDNEVKTGVFALNSLEWINEDIDQGIDLDHEAHCKECPKNTYSVSCGDCDYESAGSQYLIGFRYNKKADQYDIDTDAEYSAIVNPNENTIQVVRSNWYIDGGLCSLCYHDQVDADSTTDNIRGFAIPPEVVGDNNLLTKRIYYMDSILPAFAWPGGYPIYYIDAGSNVLCVKCARENEDYTEKIIAFDINYESDDLYCDHCSKQIESAYGADPHG